MSIMDHGIARGCALENMHRNADHVTPTSSQDGDFEAKALVRCTVILRIDAAVLARSLPAGCIKQSRTG